jgi:hypothetical protein
VSVDLNFVLPSVTLGFRTGTCFHNLGFWRHCLLLLDAVFFKHVHAYGLGFINLDLKVYYHNERNAV